MNPIVGKGLGQRNAGREKFSFLTERFSVCLFFCHSRLP
jgi:hypothetical protein